MSGLLLRQKMLDILLMCGGDSSYIFYFLLALVVMGEKFF